MPRLIACIVSSPSPVFKFPVFVFEVEMSEERKKHFNLYRFLCFPWGAFVTTPIWYGIVKVIESFLNNITITTNAGKPVGVPWWVIWALFLFGEIIIFLFIALYSYTLPKGDKRSHNIFVLISPEHFEDDKYITNDFVESFERHAKGSIYNLHIIIPPTIKRETFNRRVSHYQHKRKDFWNSKYWHKLHKKLKGSLYISGILKRRSSEGKEKFVFLLSATIGYNAFNKQITPILIDELQKNFPQRILINREFELEEFDTMTDRFATFSEYLIGWAHLVGGNIGLAYKMHLDIFINKKQSFFKRGKLNDINQLLYIELESILREYQKYTPDFISTCVNEAEQLFSDKDITTLTIARYLIMTSTDDLFDSNLSHAISLTNKARINSNNRDTIHANRAYLYLLKQKYEHAESEYNILFKKATGKIIEDVIEYCNNQIMHGCSKERPTAYYVKTLMLKHRNTYHSEFESEIEQAKKNIPSDFVYYHAKLNEMSKTKPKQNRKSCGHHKKQ